MLLASQFAYKQRFKLFNFFAFKKFNTAVLASTLVIMFFSILMLADRNTVSLAYKQTFYMLVFLLMSFLLAIFNSRSLYKLAPFIYLFSLLLLIFVTTNGTVVMGARRWIDLKIIKIQPSEFMKFSLILMLARYFEQTEDRSIWKNLIPLGVIIFIPFVAIAIQPDLATSLVCLLIAGGICFIAGLDKRLFIFIGILFLFSIPVAWQNMHEYQKLRVLNFMHPDRDPLGSGYSIMQSKIAIGSGGVFGKGIRKGSQSKLSFLPEHETDFMFTALSEETGFVGSIMILSSYLVIIVTGLRISRKSRSNFNRILSGGSSLYFIVNFNINAGMTTGLIPVAGIPMPLLSYGGSAVATSLLCIGLILHSEVNKNFIYEK